MSNFNMTPNKTPMPSQDPDVRNKNFEEVALGYTPEMAQEEAARCIHCKNKPCMKGCPVGVRIPEFIAAIQENDLDKAYEIIASTNNLPAICGRVCPQESQCESVCTRGIKHEAVAIGRLERYVADHYMAKEHPELCPAKHNGHKVAVVGAGPAGLSCAGDLSRKGYDVTIFESLQVAGGVLMYGIPEFRLPKKLVQKEIDLMVQCGVKVETNKVVGRVFTLDELMEDYGYEAVFLGTGAGLPRFLGIPGENYNGVYSANEFLTRNNLMKAYSWPEASTPINVGKHVAVVGAGNVAMDAARTAKRLGAETVSIVYRRSREELPARAEEVEHAEEEGIRFELLNNPVEILGDDAGNVTAMRVIRMELGEPDASGRRRPVPIPGSEHDLPVETVIIAIGQSPNPLMRQTTPDLKCADWGGILVDEETLATSKPGVYAGGDAVTGAATVILAMGAGKKAAASIDQYIQSKHQ